MFPAGEVSQYARQRWHRDHQVVTLPGGGLATSIADPSCVLHFNGHSLATISCLVGGISEHPYFCIDL